MTTASTLEHPQATPPAMPPDAAKAARRQSRRQGLFAPELLKTALKQSFAMLRPDVQWKNPVMFVVEVGTVLSIIFTIRAMLGYPSQASVGYLIALDVWLFLTVIFANFASALAEARGKAQADALRKTRQETPAFLLHSSGEIEQTVSTALATPAIEWSLKLGNSFPAMAKLSRALLPSMNLPLPANRPLSFAKQAATVPASPAARACCRIALSSKLPPAPAILFWIA